MLRIPITLPLGRPLRILIYARYSTDDQNHRSIDDQIAFCRHFLSKLSLADVEIGELCDRGISGEIRDRPGINAVRDGVEWRTWDVILAEDSSRLYRNESACFELVERAVDQGIRVLCPNDDVDTAEPEWEDRLHEAQRHHARANKYTSKRIKRAHDALWDMGAAIGLLKPGYLRKPTFAATAREPEKGPFFDEIDPRWTSIISNAFEQIAGKESSWKVANFLTASALPRYGNAIGQDWTDKGVIALIRNLIYRGVETFRNSLSTKVFRSGRHAAKPNDPDKILTREMPHLRIVSDALWYAANDDIDARCNHHGVPSGRDNPLWGIPRKSRGPLSGIFRCFCGATMERIGANGYRCSRAKYESGSCWNKATARAAIVHSSVAAAIRGQLNALREPLDRDLASVMGLMNDEGERAANYACLQAQVQKCDIALAGLMKLAEMTAQPPRSLLEQIERREQERDRAQAKLEEIDARQKVLEVPSKRDLLARMAEFEERLTRMDRSVRDDLALIINDLQAVPHQQFDGNKVVLRARFAFNPLGLLPPQLRRSFQSLTVDQLPESLKPKSVMIDLFVPSAGPRYWNAALELAERGIGLTAIGNKLDITKRNAHIAVQFGRKLRAAGQSDPFIELSQAPILGSRWRVHPRQAAREQPPEKIC